jgi:hypothetical protein
METASATPVSACSSPPCASSTPGSPPILSTRVPQVQAARRFTRAAWGHELDAALPIATPR